MDKKTVLVTGGSRGIGKEIVRNLARSDFNVILNYNNSEREAIETKKELAKIQKNIEIFKADVSKQSDVKKLIEFSISKYKKIDILINNAGIDQIKMFQDITVSDWNKMIKTNLTSCFYTIQEVLPGMI